MPIGPFGEALMRYSRVRQPGGGARLSQNGLRAPNADAIRMSTPSPGAIKPSEAASEAALPPEIMAYLGMMTGAPGAAAPMMPPSVIAAPPAPELQELAGIGPEVSGMGPELAGIGPEVSAIEAPLAAPPPTVSKAFRIRAPRPPDMDVQTLAITAPDETWRAAFYDSNGRQPNASDQEQRYFVQHMIQTTGAMPTKAEMLFRRFTNFAAEPGGISEFG